MHILINQQLCKHSYIIIDLEKHSRCPEIFLRIGPILGMTNSLDELYLARVALTGTFFTARINNEQCVNNYDEFNIKYYKKCR